MTDVFVDEQMFKCTKKHSKNKQRGPEPRALPPRGEWYGPHRPNPPRAHGPLPLSSVVRFWVLVVRAAPLWCGLWLSSHGRRGGVRSGPWMFFYIFFKFPVRQEDVIEWAITYCEHPYWILRRLSLCLLFSVNMYLYMRLYVHVRVHVYEKTESEKTSL